MKSLKEILAVSLASLPLLFCEGDSTIIPRNVKLSNGFSILGIVEIYEDEEGKKLTKITKEIGRYRFVVFDDGSEVVVKEQEYVGGMIRIWKDRGIRRGHELTYLYGDKEFPIWQPKEFKETSEYRGVGKHLNE